MDNKIKPENKVNQEDFILETPWYKKFLLSFWELVKMVAISLAIILPIRYFIIQPFYVKGASMEPAFHDHEYLIIDEISYRLNAPKRGDIVVFRYPENPQEYFIKRVIGLPGEAVQIKNGKIIIFNDENPSGFELDEAYIDDKIETIVYGAYGNEKVSLKDNEYFVLGDNRNASKDSRSFGPVNKSFFVGRVWFRGYPFNKIGTFKSPEYIK